MKVHNSTAQTYPNVNFGITMRKTKIDLGGSREIMNCSCFYRSDESRPLDIALAYLHHTRNAKNVEQKIWGASDLSSFCATTLAQIKFIGVNAYKKLFQRTDLMDIDPDIANRASQHVIGITETEMRLLKEHLQIRPSEYFTKIDNGERFLLEGEDTFLYEPLTRQDEKINFYRISDDIMHGTTVNADKGMIDIRKGVKRLEPHPQDTVRICEFANGWYFMPWEEQMQIAQDFSKKLQPGDILRVGFCELERNLGFELRRRGFNQINGVPEIFVKK